VIKKEESDDDDIEDPEEVSSPLRPTSPDGGQPPRLLKLQRTHTGYSEEDLISKAAIREEDEKSVRSHVMMHQQQSHNFKESTLQEGDPFYKSRSRAPGFHNAHSMPYSSRAKSAETAGVN